MSDATPLNRLPRGIPTKILYFDGPSFSLQLTQAEKDFAGLSASKVDERRSKLHNDKLKEVQVDEASKETKNQVGSKRKKPMKDSRNQKVIGICYMYSVVFISIFLYFCTFLYSVFCFFYSMFMYSYVFGCFQQFIFNVILPVFICIHVYLAFANVYLR